MNIDIDPPSDPWTLFQDWYAAAKIKEPNYPDAMILGTVGRGGMPSLRTVLMKSFDRTGIVFHTNRKSRKANEMAEHTQVSVCFYWKSLERQIRIEGHISFLSDGDSDAYFKTRPRGSQIGAWASQQSQPLASRQVFEDRVTAVERDYEGRDVPRPPHWGGYRLTPNYFEFWQERLYRLHDRITYQAIDDGFVWSDDRITYQQKDSETQWTIERLYP